MERAAATDPKRVPTLTGEKFIESSGQGWRTEARKNLWCPHYFSANSSSADRIQPSSRQDKDGSMSRTDFPLSGTAAQSTPGHKE